VTAVLIRQRGLGVPEALEWVVETTPSLAAAARAAGLQVAEAPLLVLEHRVEVQIPPGVQLRRVAADEPDLERIMAVATVAFAHAGVAVGGAGSRERDELAATSTANRSRLRERLATGETVLMVAEDRDGPIASGMHQPVADVTELLGVATLPSARRRGVGASLTCALVGHALASGLDLVFLTAASGDVARIHGRLGFRREALAGIAQVPGA
jgi:ribosomal protein S18 acetylase RimI-like enzyme